MKGNKLLEARKRLYWTQERAAEELGVGLTTIHRWERGEVVPRGDSLKLISEKYGLTPDDLGITEDGENDQPGDKSHLIVAPSPASLHYLQCRASQDLLLRLWLLAFQPYVGYQPLQDAMGLILKDYDTMHTNQSNHHIKRREALQHLVMLSMLPMSFGVFESRSLSSAPALEEILTKCSMSVIACWELSRNSGHDDLALAFHGVTTYLPTLQRIVKDTTKDQQRKDAAGLAAQCLLLKRILAQHLESLIHARSYAQEAVLYGQMSGDSSLHIAALFALAETYYYSNTFEKALQTGEQARVLMEQPAQQPIPALVKAYGYAHIAKYSAAAAKPERPTLTLFEKASHNFSDNTEDVLKLVYFDCGRENLILREGLIYRYLGNYQAASDALARIETLAPGEFAERIWLEIKLNQASVALMHPQRDMEKVITLWTTGMNGARTLQSEKRFSEACQIYNVMECLWPHEQRIRDLRDLIQHW